MPDLYWNTVDQPLRAVLVGVMTEPLFTPFRLVGGTALSLQLGHRKSVDIDLFTDAPYESIDFDAIDAYFRQHYAYVGEPTAGPVAFGRSYFVGDNPQHAVKVDIYYTDPFIREPILVDNIRMASTEEITAMKVNVIGRRGRKKIFGTSMSCWIIIPLMRCSSFTANAIRTTTRNKSLGTNLPTLPTRTTTLIPSASGVSIGRL